MTLIMKVTCPNCKKTTDYSPENLSRPFCSERCKLIDLGQWADEKYAVPGETVSKEALENPDYGDEEGDPPVRH
jgi:endogenous inhibitor of DNA gyrase (YacG/DUF329 family)